MLRIRGYGPIPLNEDTVRVIDHDFRDGRIIEQLLEDIQLADRIEELAAELLHIGQFHTVGKGLPNDLLVNKIEDLGIRHLAGKIDFSHDAVIESSAKFF